MKLTISGRHNEKNSENVNQRIKQKSLRLEKILGPQIHLRWTYSNRDEANAVELTILGAKGEFHAKAIGKNLYQGLDLVVEKIEKQIKRHKAKQQATTQRLDKSRPFNPADLADAEVDAEDEEPFPMAA